MADKLPPTADARCGTGAGAGAHRRRGEQLCELCLLTERARHRARYAENPDKAREWQRRNRAENLDSHRARDRSYYKKNSEMFRETSRAYGLANREWTTKRDGDRRRRIADAFLPVALHHHTPWTIEDDAIIRVTQDEPAVLVATQLRRTPNAIYGRRQLLRKLDRAQRIEAT